MVVVAVVFFVLSIFNLFVFTFDMLVFGFYLLPLVDSEGLLPTWQEQKTSERNENGSNHTFSLAISLIPECHFKNENNRLFKHHKGPFDELKTTCSIKKFNLHCKYKNMSFRILNRHQTKLKRSDCFQISLTLHQMPFKLVKYQALLLFMLFQVENGETLGF